MSAIGEHFARLPCRTVRHLDLGRGGILGSHGFDIDCGRRLTTAQLRRLDFQGEGSP